MSQSANRQPVKRPLDWLTAISQALLRVENFVAGALMALLLALILLNVVTRALKMPIYWIDEASVLTMIWLGFVGASVITRIRIDFAVTILADALAPSRRAALKVFASAAVLAFAIGLFVMCWRWYDPVGIAAHGFDAKAYAGASFNFFYTERTQTLEWPTWVVSLVLPIFAVTLSIHAAANLAEDLGWAHRRKQASLIHAEEAA